MRGIKPTFPISSQTLYNWVAHLDNRRPKSKILKSYVTGVRLVYIDMGYEDLAAFHSPQLERVITSLRRMRNETGSLERRPITKDLLLQMLPYFSLRTREGVTLYAVFYLTFAIFLRVGEFTYTIKDLNDSDFSQ